MRRNFGETKRKAEKKKSEKKKWCPKAHDDHGPRSCVVKRLRGFQERERTDDVRKGRKKIARLIFIVIMNR